MRPGAARFIRLSAIEGRSHVCPYGFSAVLYPMFMEIPRDSQAGLYLSGRV